MALLPSARVAVRLALANYLRTNLQAAWPNLVITENWPLPQRVFPPQAITVLAPAAGQYNEFHEPVIWRDSTSSPSGTVMYSYGRLTIPLELDAWAQFESVRDDLASSLLPLLNQNVEVTLGTATNANLANAPGLVLPIPTYSSITAEYIFDPVPVAVETSLGAEIADWRYVWKGSAFIYQIQNETQPVMKNVSISLATNGNSPDVYAFTYQGQVQADAPYLYWRLGDAAGLTAAADSSGNGHPGTATAVTFSQAGLLAVGSMTNDVNTSAGGSGAASVVNTSAISLPAGPFSVEWWVKPSALTAGQNVVGQTAYGFFSCSQNADGSLTMGTTSGSISAPAGTYAVGKVSYCVFTFDGTNARFYLNGQLVVGPTAVSAPGAAMTAFGVCPGGASWLGNFQEIALYASVLPPYRVLNHFILGSVGP